ncbi:MAG: sortase [bacterium]|nr:sortase [bacterium]
MSFQKRSFLASVANLLIGIGAVILLLDFVPIAVGEISYQIRRFRSVEYSVDTADGKKANDLFSALLNGSEVLNVEPTNKDFAVVIEKIGVNAPVVKNVSVTEKDEYFKALDKGIAHAVTSSTPDRGGNTYLFAHSSINFWQIGKYANIFNLLRKLDNDDKINVFYEGKRYQYAVIGKEVVAGFNTYPLTRQVLEPIVTLQTCYPPGTTLNRLVVTAKLVKVYK